MPRRSKIHPLLSDSYRQLLTVASLFNEYFTIDWIQELTGCKATEVLACCEKSVELGVLKRNSIGSFSFACEKIRLDYYCYLLVNDRESLNRQIVSILIKDIPDSNAKAIKLAPHLLGIFNHLEDCVWLFQAARQYAADFSTDAALTCLEKILDDLAGVHQTGADELFCDAAIEYAKLNTAKSDVKKVSSLLKEAMFRAQTLQNRRYQSMINMNFAKNKWLQSQYANALIHFQNAWTLAKSIEDETLIRSLDNFRTFLLYWQGLFKDAVIEYEKSLADIEKIPRGRFPLLAAMTVGVCYGQTGQITRGIGMIDSIRRHCLETGDAALSAHCGICIGAILLDIGHVEDALRHLKPAVEIATQMQPDWITIQGELIQAYAYYLHGENHRSLKHVKQFYRLSKLVDVSVRPWPYLMELAWAAETGLYPVFPEMSIRREVDAMIGGENVFLKGVAYRFRALLQKKDALPHDAIIESLRKSIKFLETAGHAIELSKTRLELARVYLFAGRQEQARQMAQEVCDVLIPLGAPLFPDDLKPLVRQNGDGINQFKELLSIGKNLAQSGSNRDMIAYIISTANRLTGSERGGIFLLENTGTFVLRASKNFTQDLMDLPEFSTSRKLMNDVAAAGVGMVQNLRIQDNPDAPEMETVLSSLCVPIFAGRRVLGVLYSDNRLLSNAFNDSHLDILVWLASYAAQVLENERLQREKEQLALHIENIKTHYEKQTDVREDVFFEDIVGESDAIQKVLAQVVEIAPTDTTVLILGETGVGKELAARAIVNRSRRSRLPFITLNCSALSEKLIYSELFGHEKGSFTGADRRHIGRFEKAHGGTLFLDEIGDLPVDMQVRLLRVLETKEFERVGGRDTISSDFRLITATNRHLEQEIKHKAFRADLFYRINVYPICIPPLRDRREDIPLLVDYFLIQQSGKTGKVPRPIPREDIDALVRYSWPGNVRELKNCVERYAASSRGRIAEMIDTGGHPSSPSGSPVITLADNERRHIEWALKNTGGKISGPGGAAALLDIHPNTLAFRINKLGIKKQDIKRKS